jgi:carboxyl-terminal processing protease
MMRFKPPQIFDVRILIFIPIFILLVTSPGAAKEISRDILQVAELTPNGRIQYRKMLQQELKDVMNLVETHYVDPIERKTLMQSCVNGAGAPWPDGEKIEKVFNRFIFSLDELNADSARQQMLKCVDNMVKVLGPQNEYFDADKLDKLIAENKTDAGIDISLIPNKDGYEVVNMGEESAALLSGLRPGDVIISANEVPLLSLKSEEVRKLIIGTIGSSVKLLINRPGNEGSLEITVARVPTDRGKIESKLIGNGIAHLTLRHLTTSTLSWLMVSIQELQVSKNAPIRGVVLDLRSCTGGLLNVAVGVSAAFLPEKSPVMELKGRTKNSSVSLRAEKAHYVRGKEPNPLATLSEDFKSMPLSVITGPRTSGGCEIIAAALQDNKRATIVGAQTAKQGLISEYFRPENFLSPRLKLVTSRIFRVNGRSLIEEGVSPDIAVEARTPVDIAGPGPALERAVLEIEQKVTQ